MLRRPESLTHCALCGRSMPASLLTDHHLLPKQKGGTREHIAPLCRPCHGFIHATYDNHTLATALNSLDALRRDDRIAKFVRFIRKQDVAAKFRSAPARERRRR